MAKVKIIENAPLEDLKILLEISNKFMKTGGEGYGHTVLNTFAYLLICHANACPLDLDKLSTADKGTFGHDIFGILKYLNVKTGKLTNHFLPRCALPQTTNNGE